ncbi:MAG: hypothetical protein AAFO07_34325 [Bacteroidota bacterium]
MFSIDRKRLVASRFSDEVADNLISDKELLDQFRRVEQLPQDRKRLVKEFLGAFLIKAELKQKLSL